jgi:hypothetical protein
VWTVPSRALPAHLLGLDLQTDIWAESYRAKRRFKLKTPARDFCVHRVLYPSSETTWQYEREHQTAFGKEAASTNVEAASFG